MVLPGESPSALAVTGSPGRTTSTPSALICPPPVPSDVAESDDLTPATVTEMTPPASSVDDSTTLPFTITTVPFRERSDSMIFTGTGAAFGAADDPARAGIEVVVVDVVGTTGTGAGPEPELRAGTVVVA